MTSAMLSQISDEERVALWNESYTRLELAVVLNKKAPTVNADLREYEIRPTVLVPGASHPRYNAIAGMYLLVADRLSRHGFRRGEIKEFLSIVRPLVQHMPTQDMDGAILVVSQPNSERGKAKAPNFYWHHFTESAETKLTDRINELMKTGQRYCAVRLGVELVEFLERSLCLKKRIDYDSVVAERNREFVKKFQRLFQGARETQYLEQHVAKSGE